VLQIAVSPVFSIKLYMWFITNLFCVNNYKLHIYIYIYISFVTKADEVAASYRRTSYNEIFELKSEVNVATILDLLTSPSFFLD
jgi:hypothetical protein